MVTSDVKSIIEEVERLLAEEELSDRTELAIQELLNVVEALCADKKLLADEVERLRKHLEQKKKAKNSSNGKKDDQDSPGDDDSANSDHSSEKRGSRAKSLRQTTDARSKISPSTTRLNVQSIPARCLPMPCDFKMKSWSFRISKSSPRILNSNGTFSTQRRNSSTTEDRFRSIATMATSARVCEL